MKRLISLAAAGCLALGGLALAGCQSTANTPYGNNAGTAGGNGEFGESPAQPGSYTGERAHPAQTNSPANAYR
jgi:hypothetical protein